MRKRISCKIINSVTLDAGIDQPRQSYVTNLQQPKISEIGAFSYTHRLVVTKHCIDEKPFTGFLDCCA